MKQNFLVSSFGMADILMLSLDSPFPLGFRKYRIATLLLILWHFSRSVDRVIIFNRSKNYERRSFVGQVVIVGQCKFYTFQN